MMSKMKERERKREGKGKGKGKGREGEANDDANKVSADFTGERGKGGWWMVDTRGKKKGAIST